MCLCGGGSEGGWGTREGINRIKQAAQEIKAVFGFMVLSVGSSFLLKPRLSALVGYCTLLILSVPNVCPACYILNVTLTFSK